MRSVLQVFSVAAAIASVAAVKTLHNEKDNNKRQQKIVMASSGFMTRSDPDGPDPHFHCRRSDETNLLKTGAHLLETTKRQASGRSSAGRMMRKEEKHSEKVGVAKTDPLHDEEPSDLDDGMGTDEPKDADDAGNETADNSTDDAGDDDDSAAQFLGVSAKVGSSETADDSTDDAGDDDDDDSVAQKPESDADAAADVNADDDDTNSDTSDTDTVSPEADADPTHTEGTGVDGDDDNPAVPTTGAGNCSEDFVIDGNFCEETCTDPDGALSQAIELCPGTCSAQGFNVGKGVLKVAWFSSDESALPKAGAFVAPPNCGKYHVIKHGICESFCVDEGNKAFAESRTGIVRASCADSGYTKFVMHGKVTFNIKA